MTVLVCIPFYGPDDLLRRAVRSVLAQTERDIHVLVVGDGRQPKLGGIRDGRLEVYTLPHNRGPYFAQQLALTASPHRWYAPHGADDWSEPDHLERLLAVGGEAVITGAVWFHKGRKVSVHRASYEVGVFTRRRLLSFGGYNPAERIGQDTLTIRLLRITGELRATDQPTYHRVKREGALTTAPQTGLGSPARNEMRRRNRAVFGKARELRQPYLIRHYRRRLVPARIAAELAQHVECLAPLLGTRAAA